MKNNVYVLKIYRFNNYRNDQMIGHGHKRRSYISVLFLMFFYDLRTIVSKKISIWNGWCVKCVLMKELENQMYWKILTQESWICWENIYNGKLKGLGIISLAVFTVHVFDFLIVISVGIY